MQKTLARQIPGATDTVKIGTCDRYGDRDNASRHVLETIFRLEYGGLIRFLTRQVGQELASDIAQEVFLRAVASPQLPILCNPRGFLFRIARNAIIDHARRQRCRIVTLPLIETVDASCAAEQEHQLEVDDLKAILVHALSRLPEKTRRVFIMHRFDGMAYRDIHHQLGISVATVEYHMMKALAHIRVAVAGRF